MIHYETDRQEGRLWLKESGFSPDFELKTESVFAQCNGYMGVRAAHPLSLVDVYKRQPLFKMLSAIGLSNSREAVIICMIVQTLPTAIYMTRSYFDTIPAELEEACLLYTSLVSLRD